MAVPGSGAVPVPARAVRNGGGGGPIDFAPGEGATGALDAFGALAGRAAGRGGGFGDSVKETPRAVGEYATAHACARPEHYKEIIGDA